LAAQNRAPTDKARHGDRGRPGINLFGAGTLQHTAPRHHRHPVRHRQRLALVMGDEQHRRPGAALKIGKFVFHRRAQVRVKVGQGFVHQNGFRALGKTTRQRHTLSLPPGQFGRATIGKSTKADSCKVTIRLAPRAAPTRTANLGRKTDIVAHRHMRPQRIGLKHHTHRTPLGGNMHIGARHDLITDHDLPLVQLFKPGNKAQKRAFATSRRPDNRHKLTRLNLKIDTVNSQPRGKPLARAGDLQRHGISQPFAISCAQSATGIGTAARANSCPVPGATAILGAIIGGVAPPM